MAGASARKSVVNIIRLCILRQIPTQIRLVLVQVPNMKVGMGILKKICRQEKGVHGVTGPRVGVEIAVRHGAEDDYVDCDSPPPPPPPPPPPSQDEEESPPPPPIRLGRSTRSPQSPTEVQEMVEEVMEKEDIVLDSDPPVQETDIEIPEPLPPPPPILERWEWQF